MAPNLPILAKPLQPGWLRQCPSCKRLFAISQVRIEADSRVGAVHVYACRYCDHEAKHTQELPPHVV